MADLSIQLGWFDLSSPPFSGKQKLAPGNQNVQAGHEQAGLVTCNGPRKLELGLEERILHPGWSRLGKQKERSPREENVIQLSGEKAAVAGSRACRQQL